MLLNYFVSAYRSLFKSPLYTAINVAGLGVGLAAFIMILLYVRGESSFESWIPNVDRIYQIQTRFDLPGRDPFFLPRAPGPVKEAMLEAFSEVDTVGQQLRRRANVKRGEKLFFEDVYLVDSDFLKLVPIPFLEGDPKTALRDTSSIVLSETLKVKYFGDEPALGATLSINDDIRDREFRVTGVVADPPSNSELRWDLLGLLEKSEYSERPWLADEWTSSNTITLVQLKPGADGESVNRDLPAFEKQYAPDVKFGGQNFRTHEFLTLSLMPLRNVHLHAIRGTGLNLVGAYRSVVTFAVVALLILTIACINFMNLSTARASERAREVSLRKLLGARRRDLVTQFLGESTLLALIALFLALAIVELALPSYNAALDREMTMSWFGRESILPWVIGLVLLVGVGAGLYPAFYLSGFQPARVLKANRSSFDHGSSRFRGVLVVTQFAVAIALMICTAVVLQQYRLIQFKDLGFERENVLVIRGLARSAAQSVSDTLVEEFHKLPGVTGVTRTSSVPGDSGNHNVPVEIPGEATGEPIVITRVSVDFDFFENYDVKLAAGRVFDRDVSEDHGLRDLEEVASFEPGRKISVLLNKSGVSHLGFLSPEAAVGSTIRFTAADDHMCDATIIGVVNDFHFKSIHRSIRPTFFYRNQQRFANLSVHFDGDPIEIVKRAEGTWRTLLPGLPFQAEFLDENLTALYRDERARLGMFGAFSLLAIVIACLGLYGLASFSATRRKQEIGIRKVLGASTIDIVRLLVWQFSKPVLVANLIAWPVAAWVMWDWLQGFQYHVDLNPLIFGLAAMLALSIAWSTVSGHAIRFARTRPSRALRYE